MTLKIFAAVTLAAALACAAPLAQAHEGHRHPAKTKKVKKTKEQKKTGADIRFVVRHAAVGDYVLYKPGGVSLAG